MTGLGFHFQQTVPDWPRAVAKLPPGSPTKAVSPGAGVQLLSEAKANNPHSLTVLRHWYDSNQIFDTTDEAILLDRARRFFSAFIDGTFMDHAANVDAVEEWNEYNAQSHSVAEQATRAAWARAAVRIWNDEYRNKRDLRHIRLVIGNVPVGNDALMEQARLSHQYDAYLGYHPYIPFMLLDPTALPFGVERKRLIEVPDYRPSPNAFAPQASMFLDNEWPYVSGRWTVMDKRFVAAGYRNVKWLFTETGPIGFHLWPDGGLSLHANDGWRHPDVCNGDVDLYLEVMQYWWSRTYAWNQAHNNRARGAVCFTSGGGSHWRYFETRQPEMDRLAAAFNQWAGDPPDPPIDPPVDPPDNPLRDILWREGQAAQLIQFNSGAALQAAIFDAGFVPNSSEFYFSEAGVDYVGQRSEKLNKPIVRMYYAVRGDWGNVKFEEYRV